MKSFLRIFGLMIFAIGFASISLVAQNSWPKEIPLDNGGKIVIYQPQPESFNGNILSARAAVSIATSENADQTFGSIWFDAVLETDKDSHTGTLESLNIKEAKFPGIKDQQQLLQYTTSVQNEVPRWNMQFSLDQLLTSVQQTQKLNDPNLKNDAPNIIYKNKPTTLIIIDGEPKLQLDKETQLQKVVNTPSTIVLNPDDNLYYLYGGGLWYSSQNILSGWNYSPNLPIKIQQLNDQIQQQVSKNPDSNNQDKPVTPTDILVSTTPAELIQTEGNPTYQSVEGTNLLYIDNSLNDIFKDINTQQNYILISGRWYTSTSLYNGWTYVSANQLPADFAKIPEGTEKDGVLSSVAGTNAANEALMDAQIPQTAKIDRRTATTSVTYDGTPIFNPIQGTNLQVAVNSSITVLKSNVNGMYYAVDNGVWFISNTYNGPWQVSTERPYDVNNIPPENIAYNTKYVNVYDYNDDYVYAGYTPGYLGCYVYGPTVVWGTGWHYHSWYRNQYYARPYTWGFGMTYNPWTGWSIGYVSGYSLGWNYYDQNPHSFGWFGPRSYHPSYRPWGYNGGYYGRRDMVINQPRIMVNRPAYVNVNVTNRVNNHQLFANTNHSINLYNHVVGARTVDINRRSGQLNTPTNNFNRINKGGVVVHPQMDNGATRNFNNPTLQSRVASPPPNNNNNNNNNIGRGQFGGSNNKDNNGMNRPNIQPINAIPNNNTGRPLNNNNNIDRPFARPSTQENNIATDRQGNIYKLDNGAVQQRTNNVWKPALPTQAKPEVNNVQQQRDRGNQRESNFRSASPAPTQAPARQQSAPPQRSNNNGKVEGRRDENRR